MDYKAVARVKMREWAIDQLGGVCIKCGTADDLQFDHIDYRSKAFDISAAIRDGYSRERVAAELTKCQLLCTPHHREKTVAEGSTGGGWNKIRDPQHGTAVWWKRGCRCEECRTWKSRYRLNVVDSLGNPRYDAAVMH